MTSWFILGCGYVGGVLARRLAGERHEVVVTRRHAEDAQATALEIGGDVRGIALDLADHVTAAITPRSIIVCLAPPGASPDREAAALASLAGASRRIVYISSTGVYAPANGAWVDEHFPLEPTTTSGKARIAAERIVAAAPISSIALRAAGIYGPGRTIADRIAAGTYRIIGDGTAHVSRIHVTDLVEAIVRAGTSELTGAVNIADDDPAPIGFVADAIATRRGLPLPPRIAPEAVDREIAGMLTANRRISNRRMKQELGVVLRYPSWRDAIAVD